MRKIGFLVAGLAVLVTLAFNYNTESEGEHIMSESIYDYKVNTIDGQAVSMSGYKGKVLLVVNVASKCGFTKQYTGLEALYAKYQVKGLEVLGFPCNQFGSQEPGTSAEIKSFCSLTYGVSFPMFEKVEVNGEDTHPLYAFLKAEKPGVLGSKAIKWNFTKFLVDKEGNVLKRFASSTKPEDIAAEIEALL